jgi:hypothetical protein
MSWDGGSLNAIQGLHSAKSTTEFLKVSTRRDVKTERHSSPNAEERGAATRKT